MLEIRVRLPEGGAQVVQVAEDGDPLHEIVAEALGEPPESLELVVGVTSKTHVAAGDKRTARELGVSDREVISVRRLASAQQETTAPPPLRRRRPRQRQNQMQEQRAEESVGDTRETIAKNLVQAFQGGPRDNVSVFLRKATRGFMNDAHARRDAIDRYAAALAGKFEVVRPERGNASNGSSNEARAEFVSIRYAPEKGSKWKQDSVKLLSRTILQVTVRYVLTVDDQDCAEAAREKMRPRELALHSPNVFWSLAVVSAEEAQQQDHEGGETSLEDALRRLCPDLDWEFLSARRRDKSAKAIQAEETAQKLQLEKERRKAEAEERKRKRSAAQQARQNMGAGEKRQRRLQQQADLTALKGVFDNDAALVRSIKMGLNLSTVLELAAVPEGSLLRVARKAQPEATPAQASTWLHRAKTEAAATSFADILGNDEAVAAALRDKCGVTTPHDLERLRIPGRTELAVEMTGKSEAEVRSWRDRAAELLEKHPILKGIRSRG
ncbi:Hypothetical Protein FCC1311_040532 [Hondaea fermentalgiana]|uniref:Uncharacterized protein n=1 Tax=Hondaea fermentalgiana TaxID=2315210 RepID=A0A2R5G9X5_9STRA|nr:Hypothetical Protein FCC1311_040532 [Hondaea fermentalgiana]|eukprot:GBG27830.1 Hypothetical Protein FCC1311_040532 [Hondaea fermentalgiana]